jgi:hypothetical protein
MTLTANEILKKASYFWKLATLPAHQMAIDVFDETFSNPDEQEEAHEKISPAEVFKKFQILSKEFEDVGIDVISTADDLGNANVRLKTFGDRNIKPETRALLLKKNLDHVPSLEVSVSGNIIDIHGRYTLAVDHLSAYLRTGIERFKEEIKELMLSNMYRTPSRQERDLEIARLTGRAGNIVRGLKKKSDMKVEDTKEYPSVTEAKAYIADPARAAEWISTLTEEENELFSNEFKDGGIIRGSVKHDDGIWTFTLMSPTPVQQKLRNSLNKFWQGVGAKFKPEAKFNIEVTWTTA